MRHLAFIAILVLIASGCEAEGVEHLTDELKDKSADIQTSVTETIESKKIEAEKVLNEKKNTLLQDLIDDVKNKTDINLNK